MPKFIKCTDQDIIEAAEQEPSAMHAAARLNIRYSTYRRHAIRLGVFKPNPGQKGVKNKNKGMPFTTEDILNGKHPHYASNPLKKRLLNEGYKEHRCEQCNGTEWLGKVIPLELDHIDGNCYNHTLLNLRLLCPNCHAFTDTYRGRNK